MNDRDCEKCKHHTEKGCDSWDCSFEKRMTREDAIKRLKLWLICSEEYTEDDVSMNEAIRIAINSLEQEPCDKCVYSTKDGCCQYDDITETIPPFEPCEDAISRQAVLDLISKFILEIHTEGGRDLNAHTNDVLRQILRNVGSDRVLPSVKPQVICPSHGIDCEDCPAYEPKESEG